MRVGLVSTLATPVREHGVGSVEAVVWLLATELTALGHEVTVFAAAGSAVRGARVVAVDGTYGQHGMPGDYQLCELLNVAQALEHAAQLDVLHTHNYLLGRLLEQFSPVPLVHTLHTQPYDSEAVLARRGPRAPRLTALSRYQWHAHPELDPVVVPHGVHGPAFTFRAQPEPQLCYLGRFRPGKGPLQAVRVARELGMPLVLAGPEDEHFTEVVRPHVDERTVHYVGTVDGASRDRLLGSSAALLYPVRHGEPFGLVMAEAMMCGTPVVATDVGAVPEVVEDGVTGVIAPEARLVEAAAAALALDRWRVRQAAEQRFDARLMAQRYACVYAAAVDERWADRHRQAVPT